LMVAVAASAASGQGKCHPPLTSELHVSVPGRSFSVMPTPDGCWVFVSMHARPDGTGGGLAVIDMHGDVPKLSRTVTGPSTIRQRDGMALTHDGRFLMLGLMGRISVYDVHKLISNDADPLAGEYIPDDKQTHQYFEFAITTDDRTMFVSDHADEAITVIDLAETKRSNFRKFAVIGDIPIGWGATSVVLSRDGRRLYALTQIADDSWKWKKAVVQSADPMEYL